MNIGFLITARLKSKRLPFKVIKTIKGKSVLSHMINRIKKTKHINKIIVCTTKLTQDDKIEKLHHKMRFSCVFFSKKMFENFISWS